MNSNTCKGKKTFFYVFYMTSVLHLTGVTIADGLWTGQLYDNLYQTNINYYPFETGTLNL